MLRTTLCSVNTAIRRADTVNPVSTLSLRQADASAALHMQLPAYQDIQPLRWSRLGSYFRHAVVTHWRTWDWEGKISSTSFPKLTV